MAPSTADKHNGDGLIYFTAPRRPSRLSRGTEFAIRLVGSIAVFLILVAATPQGLPWPLAGVMSTSEAGRNGHGPTDSVAASSAKVELEAHIMSKCPDAKDCLELLLVDTLQNVTDIADFRLSYIGSTPEGADAVECMHGPEECLGNMLQLCAQALYPAPKLYVGFAACMIRDYHHIPERRQVEDCALEHGLDFGAINDCASDEGDHGGTALLRASVARSAAANVTKSCTVRLNGRQRCIRDGGAWKNCGDGHTPEELVRDIRILSKYGR